jgi:hypothetical protein
LHHIESIDSYPEKGLIEECIITVWIPRQATTDFGFFRVLSDKLKQMEVEEPDFGL